MDNLLATLTHYRAVKNQIGALTAEADAIKADVIDYMDARGVDALTVGQYSVSNKEVTRTGIDEKRLRAEAPDVARAYEKTTTYKRFTVK